MKNIGTKEIETDRLILRRLTVEDAESAYYGWCTDKDVAMYVTWDVHGSIEETKELYKTWVQDYESLETYRWGVEVKDTHELIGTIDVPSKKFLKYGTYVIGYVYKKSAWGKGYGTEALKAVIKYLFEEVGAETIYADYMVNNPASGKVMKKAGMTFEGTLRSRITDKNGVRNDLGYYSITKEEYLNSKEK